MGAPQGGETCAASSGRLPRVRDLCDGTGLPKTPSNGASPHSPPHAHYHEAEVGSSG